MALGNLKSLDQVRPHPSAPLLVVDVDEVLAQFVRGFETYVTGQGLEMRVDRYALLQNIYRPGETEHIDVAAGRQLFEGFFRNACDKIDPAPGAAAALKALASDVSVVILTNAPDYSRELRARWLLEHGFDYPLIVNEGLKGQPVAALAARTTGKVAFVDDLLPNLDSVEQAAPAVSRFQMIADERLRPMAPSAPDRHVRIDRWAEMGPALAAALL